MEGWALEGVTTLANRYKKSDAARNIVVYVLDDCLFRVSTIYSPSKECVVVYSLNEVHHCRGAASVHRGESSQQSWLKEYFQAYYWTR